MKLTLNSFHKKWLKVYLFAWHRQKIWVLPRYWGLLV